MNLGYKTILDNDGKDEADLCSNAFKKYFRIKKENKNNESMSKEDEIRFTKYMRCFRFERGDGKNPYINEVEHVEKDKIASETITYDKRDDGKKRPDFGTKVYNAFCHMEDRFGYDDAFIGWKSISKKRRDKLDDHERDCSGKFGLSLGYVRGGVKNDPWGVVNCAWCGKEWMNSDVVNRSDGDLTTCPSDRDNGVGSCSQNISKGKRKDESVVGLIWKFIVEELKCYGCGTSTGFRSITQDHSVARANKGAKSRDNIRPLCSACNSEKGTSVGRFKSVHHEKLIGMTKEDAIVDMLYWMDFYKIPDRAQAIVDGRAVAFHGESDAYASRCILDWYMSNSKLKEVRDRPKVSSSIFRLFGR